MVYIPVDWIERVVEIVDLGVGWAVKVGPGEVVDIRVGWIARVRGMVEKMADEQQNCRIGR